MGLALPSPFFLGLPGHFRALCEPLLGIVPPLHGGVQLPQRARVVHERGVQLRRLQVMALGLLVRRRRGRREQHRRGLPLNPADVRDVRAPGPQAVVHCGVRWIGLQRLLPVLLDDKRVADLLLCRQEIPHS